MHRRRFLWLFLLAFPARTAPRKALLRGKLKQETGRPPALETPGGRAVYLEGDEPTMGVLKDQRLAGEDMELIGQAPGSDRFVVDPIHTRAIFVYKGSKKLMVTYWCEVCSIRTYTPGKCWCCQQETALDLQDPDQP